MMLRLRLVAASPFLFVGFAILGPKACERLLEEWGVE